MIRKEDIIRQEYKELCEKHPDKKKTDVLYMLMDKYGYSEGGLRSMIYKNVEKDKQRKRHKRRRSPVHPAETRRSKCFAREYYDRNNIISKAVL